MLGRITVRKTSIVKLIIYKPLKDCTDPSLFKENSEGITRMVKEAARHAPLRVGKVLIMGSLNHKEIGWENSDSNGYRESWRQKFLEGH